jgi:competence protein ComFB
MAKKDFKKELSKELMYKKIMPSASKAETAEKISAGFDAASPSYSTGFTSAQSNPAVPYEDEDQPALPTPAVNSHASQPVAAPVQAPQTPVLMNLMEYLVSQRVDEVLAKFNCCNCSKCKKDAIALALNKLPPKYVVKINDPTLDYTKNKSAAEILTALIQAVLTVRANPRHDEAK